MTSFKGRVAIVTGGSRGIGLAIAARLVEQGARVCITGRDGEALERAAKDLGDSAVFCAGKADDPVHQDDTVGLVLDAFGKVDLLVNNAAVNPVFGGIIGMEPAVATKILAVNTLAALAWIRKARDAWMGEHGGSVVNIASIAALRGSPGLGMYGVSKAALVRLTTELAIELAPAVRVNAVLPGVVKTKFAAAVFEGREQELAATYPLNRLGMPDDIASAVSFLLSDEASWLTGVALVADGGLTLGGLL
jgi:NAD(P)-dependent dehydrogenase (short-subunit alcohol dehydrogenase family)